MLNLAHERYINILYRWLDLYTLNGLFRFDPTSLDKRSKKSCTYLTCAGNKYKTLQLRKKLKIKHPSFHTTEFECVYIYISGALLSVHFNQPFTDNQNCGQLIHKKNKKNGGHLLEKGRHDELFGGLEGWYLKLIIKFEVKPLAVV